VISSVGLAIITDLFRMEVRGRVMGFTQMAFAASQVLGLSDRAGARNRYGWHSPFLMVGLSAPSSVSRSLSICGPLQDT